MKRLAVSIAVTAWMLSAGPAWASTCDTLQADMDAAAAGATVTLDAGQICAGQYTLNSVGIKLVGGAGAGFDPGPTVEGRSLIGNSVGPTEIRSLIFRGDDAARGGVRVTSPSSLIVADSTFEGIKANEPGGGLYVQTSATPHVELLRNSFTNNSSNNNGGGARIRSGNALVVGNTFTANTADRQGGGLALSVSTADQQSRDSAAPGDDTFARADIGSNTFKSNQADEGGGGLVIVDRQDDIDSSEPGYACCNFSPSPSVRLESNVYDSNTVGPTNGEGYGGGANFVGVFATSDLERYILNRILPGGSCDGPCPGGEGGGISAFGTFSRNASFSATNLAVAGNSVGAGGGGGGIYIGGFNCQTPPARGSTREEVNACSTQLNLLHATIAGNTVAGGSQGGGISADPPDEISIRKSIVFGNPSGEGTPEITGTSNVVVTKSDACQTAGVAYVDPDPGPNTNICTDPKLRGPTAAGGGDVHQTLPSPTYDRIVSDAQGNTPIDYEADVRPIISSSRSSTPFDMGADEYDPAEFGVTITDAPDPVAVGGLITYTVTVDNGGPGPAENTQIVVSLPAPAARLLARLPDGCTGTTTVTCALGTIAVGGSRVLTFGARPTAPGTVTASVNVASTSDDLTLDDHVASTTTVVTAPPAPPPPPAGGALPAVASLPAAKTCTSRRVFQIRIRKFRHDKVTSATVRVNGKIVKVVRGKRLKAPVVLTGLPKGTFTVSITAKTRNGKTLRGVRRYHTCIPKLAGGIPPL